MLGAGVACPCLALAQQRKPVIGWLSSFSAAAAPKDLSAFQDGLREQGFIDGRDVAITYRWAEGHYDRLPGYAAELVRQPVALIIAAGTELPARAAIAATSTIPIVFTTGEDPVAIGLVRNLNRPGGNVTGATMFAAQLTAKDIELACDLLPKVASVAFLVNPDNAVTPTMVADAERAAKALGVSLGIYRARSVSDLEPAVAAAANHHSDALVVSGDPFLNAVAVKRVVALAVEHGLPAISSVRLLADMGGLASYGGSVAENYRTAGTYAGRILKGERVGDLPVTEATRFELVINLKVAKALGIAVPREMLLRADDVIE